MNECIPSTSHPLPLTTINLFSISMSLFCSVLFNIQSPLREIKLYLAYSIWLIPLSIMFSSSIHVVPNNKISNYMNYAYIFIYRYRYISHNFFIFLSPINKNLSCFCILAVINTGVMNIGVYIYFQISVFCWVFCFPDQCPKTDLLDPRQFYVYIK